MTPDRSEEHQHTHPRGHGEHGHTHGAVHPTIATSERGIWAIKWSFLMLAVTALSQLVVVLLSGSVALLSDTIHNFGDAATAGYPLADPLVGLLIAAAILVIVWQSGKAVFTRLLDGVEPGAIEEIRHAASHLPRVEDVSEVRARWLGHRLHAEVNVAVDPDLSVAEGHAIAREVNHQLLHHLSYLSGAVIHVDPVQEAGEEHHRIPAHSHDGLPPHSH